MGDFWKGGICAMIGCVIGQVGIAYYYKDEFPNACRDQGYYEQSGKVIVCRVIDKSELIKRSL